MLAEITAALRCPLCRGGLGRTDGSLTCPAGHAYDIARQGYVNLLTGRVPDGVETPAMVAARAEVFAAGHLAFLTAALADAAAAAAPTWPGPPGLVVDAGAGTGGHLAGVLDRLPGHAGLALDLARPAARRAARAHPRAGAAVADTWRRLPLADGCADLLLDVFAPRNGPEFARVLRPTGTALVATPAPAHLAELVDRLGLLRVDPDKERRVAATLSPHLVLAGQRRLTRVLRLSRDDVARFVAMGPSAWHQHHDRIREELEALPQPLTVTASVDLRTFRPRGAAAPAGPA
jgi:23S rRNA (guanine745-N1)-methyltransferase